MVGGLAPSCAARRLTFRLPKSNLQTIDQTVDGSQRIAKCCVAGRLNLEAPAGTTAPLRRGLACPRRDESLSFHPVERRVHGAYRHLPARTRGEFAPDVHAVGVVTKTKNGEEDELFEFPEKIAFTHTDILCKAEDISSARRSRRRSAGARSARVARERDLAGLVLRASLAKEICRARSALGSGFE